MAFENVFLKLNFIDKQRFEVSLASNRILSVLLKAWKKDFDQTNEILFKKVYSNDKFNDARIRKAKSELNRLLLDFIGSITITEQQKHLNRIQFFKDHELYAELEKEYKKSTVWNEEVEELFLDYQDQHVRSNSNNKIDEIARQKDRDYLLQKLRLECRMLTYKTVYDRDYQNKHLDFVLNDLMEDFKSDPIIKSYLVAIDLLNEQNESDYSHLKEMMQNGVVASPKFVRELNGYLKNFCIKRINKGEVDYLKEVFEIFQMQLKDGSIYENGILSESNYKNIVTTACRLKAFDWVALFIESEKKNLKKSQQKNAYTYNSAKLAFHLKDYDRVERLLFKVEYDDIFYNLDSKIMLIKIFYEQSEIDQLDLVCGSLNAFLIRNKVLSNYQKETYSNLIKYVKRLVRIPEGDSSKLKRLEAKIQSNRNVADIIWLEEQLAIKF